ARAHGERAAAEGALKVLQESPEMRGIQALQRMREEAQQKEAALRLAETDLTDADERARTAAGDEMRLSVDAESAGIAANAAAADLEEILSAWVDRREGASPLEQTLNEARAAVAQTFAGAQADLAARRAQRDAEARIVADEIAHLESGTHAPPLAPPLRAAD